VGYLIYLFNANNSSLICFEMMKSGAIPIWNSKKGNVGINSICCYDF
jgi:hypothetical protein